jgi:hypothetical protein
MANDRATGQGGVQIINDPNSQTPSKAIPSFRGSISPTGVWFSLHLKPRPFRSFWFQQFYGGSSSAVFPAKL